jgi:drug/metabolite transporter (DMT)-like permease
MHLLKNGYFLAFLTVLIWSGNYVVAKGISADIPPVSLAFLRWSVACVGISFLAFNKFKKEWPIVKKHLPYFFVTALTGIAIFNTFIYLAGHYTSAINMALIGTTVAPIFTNIFAHYYLKEKASIQRVLGMAICFGGIVLLISKGSWATLQAFTFSKGDVLMFISAFAFAIYSTLNRKKPLGVAPIVFLAVNFFMGTAMLLPFTIWEQLHTTAIVWTSNKIAIIAYIGIGNSVIAFLFWNLAISKIGASKTVIFSSLMPIFSTIEAIIFLNEQFTVVHAMSGVIVMVGIAVANIEKGK